jgi:hypothetical protein
MFHLLLSHLLLSYLQELYVGRVQVSVLEFVLLVRIEWLSCFSLVHSKLNYKQLEG